MSSLSDEVRDMIMRSTSDDAEAAGAAPSVVGAANVIGNNNTVTVAAGAAGPAGRKMVGVNHVIGDNNTVIFATDGASAYTPRQVAILRALPELPEAELERIYRLVSEARASGAGEGDGE